MANVKILMDEATWDELKKKKLASGKTWSKFLEDSFDNFKNPKGKTMGAQPNQMRSGRKGKPARKIKTK